jgi:hypothetical protein
MAFALLRVVLAAVAVILMAMSALLPLILQSRVGFSFGFGGLSLGTAFLFAMLAWDRRSRKL